MVSVGLFIGHAFLVLFYSVFPSQLGNRILVGSLSCGCAMQQFLQFCFLCLPFLAFSVILIILSFDYYRKLNHIFNFGIPSFVFSVSHCYLASYFSFWWLSGFAPGKLTLPPLDCSTFGFSPSQQPGSEPEVLGGLVTSSFSGILHQGTNFGSLPFRNSTQLLLQSVRTWPIIRSLAFVGVRVCSWLYHLLLSKRFTAFFWMYSEVVFAVPLRDNSWFLVCGLGAFSPQFLWNF